MPAFDLLLRGGIVVDGSGGPARLADVDILGDRILAVGDLGAVDTADVELVLDVDGRAVAPGFIDPHGHSDGSVLVDGALETAVAKLTSVPAARLGLRDRGVVREGALADVVVFDPVKVADEATYEEPARYSQGIDHVIVNGRAAILDGAETGERTGLLRRDLTARGTIGAVTATETPAIARLAGGPVLYTLRRSARSRGLRVVLHPERGVIVTVPVAGRRGWADPERHVQAFLAEREPWLRRHLDRQARERAELAARGGLRDGATIRFRGDLHRLRVEPARDGVRRSSVERVGGLDEDELIVRLAATDRRSTAGVLEAWLKPRARAAIQRDIHRHAAALGVVPGAVSVRDQRTRWGSASRHGRLAFSWRLVLAPPEALETVVIHELAHLKVFGHGPRFWAVVASRRADHRTWRRWLRDHSTELHGALADGTP